LRSSNSEHPEVEEEAVVEEDALVEEADQEVDDPVWVVESSVVSVPVPELVVHLPNNSRDENTTTLKTSLPAASTRSSISIKQYRRLFSYISRLV